MRTLPLLFALLFSFSSFGEEFMAISYFLEEQKADPTLKNGHAVFEFNLKNVPYVDGETIQYSVDGEAFVYQIQKDRKIVVNTTSGSHQFQFYYNQDYQEIYTGPLEIKSKVRAKYGLIFSPGYRIEAEKPVIYLYPEKEMEVEVKIDIKGSNPFLYPAYNDGWKFKASPSGDLSFGEDVYNYLFWEAEHTLVPSRSLEGFIVDKSTVISFLEEKLSAAGLTSKEQADFITYWAPRMMMHENCFVHFKFNEECDEYATLNITPKPTNINRIFMEWQPIHTKYRVVEQTIPVMKRDGFTVIEWGGAELPALVQKLNTYPVTK